MPTKAHILITEDNVDIQAIYQAKLSLPANSSGKQ